MDTVSEASRTNNALFPRGHMKYNFKLWQSTNTTNDRPSDCNRGTARGLEVLRTNSVMDQYTPMKGSTRSTYLPRKLKGKRVSNESNIKRQGSNTHIGIRWTSRQNTDVSKAKEQISNTQCPSNRKAERTPQKSKRLGPQNAHCAIIIGLGPETFFTTHRWVESACA